MGKLFFSQTIAGLSNKPICGISPTHTDFNSVESRSFRLFVELIANERVASHCHLVITEKKICREEHESRDVAVIVSLTSCLHATDGIRETADVADLSVDFNNADCTTDTLLHIKRDER